MSEGHVPEITVAGLTQKLNSGESFVLLDVREAWELDCALIRDARLRVAPLSRLAQLGEAALPDELEDKSVETLVICHHGVRSAHATGWLMEHGWSNVYSVRGGIAEYARVIDPAVGRY